MSKLKKVNFLEIIFVAFLEASRLGAYREVSRMRLQRAE